jgi:hypothetical protein
MKKIIFLALNIFTISAFAQQDAASKHAALITKADLKKHLTIIAGDEFEGRGTGTAGQRKAAAYIEKQFKTFGLTKPQGMKGYQQMYPLTESKLQKVALNINGIAAEHGKDFLVPMADNVTAKFTAADLVFVGYGIDDDAYNDYKNVDVKGKLVVFFSGEPKKDGKYFISADGKQSKYTFEGAKLKLAIAKAKGAVGGLVVSPSMESFSKRLVENNTASGLNFESIPEPKTITIPYAIVSHAFAKKIMPSTFEANVVAAKAKNMFTIDANNTVVNAKFNYKKKEKTINASNVLGVIEGTDKKDEYVFVTAHYDHLGIHDGVIYYGADDDGSGTCGLIQMAYAFSEAAKNGNRPRRSIVFMAVSGEEKGLWGSEYYSDHPILPLEKTSVDLNIDMIGRIDTERKTADTLNYVYVVGHNKLSTELPIINEGQNNKYTNVVLDYKFDDPKDPNRIYYRSDHYNFARKGVPVLFFYDGMLKSDYHQPTDTVDKIYFDLYEKRTQMIFYTAWEMANRDAMLKRDIPLD